MHCFLMFPKEYISPTPNPTQPNPTRRGRGKVAVMTSLYSFNLVRMVWAVAGGLFITNCLLSNYFGALMKPVFETPVESAQAYTNICKRCKTH